MVAHTVKQLLVLDVNGLLIDTYYEGEARPDRPHDEKVNKFHVYKRPFCDKFIQFCLENFVVGVWSSALEHNVVSLVEYVFKEAKQKLAFIWHQKHCTDTGFRHPENKYKPLFLKELWRLWKKYETSLPWTEGDYGPANTLLIDDSPYKALNNPPHSAIFPKTYKATNLEDNYLEGELRVYLDGLRKSTDVQAYLRGKPIGEPSIVVGDPQWADILSSVKLKNESQGPIPPHFLGTTGPVISNPGHHRPKRRDALIPGNAGSAPYMGNEGRHSRKDHFKDRLLSHSNVGPELHGHFPGGGFRHEYPGGDAGFPWIPGRLDEPAHMGVLSGNRPLPLDMRRMEGETFGFDQGFDHPWLARPDLVPHARGHHEGGSLSASLIGGGFPGSDPGPGWMSNEIPHLLRNHLEPLLPSDWTSRPLEAGQPVIDSSIPIHFGMPHVGVDAPMQRVAYEDFLGERPDYGRGHPDGGSFTPSGLTSSFPEMNAAHAWQARPRPNDLPHLPSNIIDVEHDHLMRRRVEDLRALENGHFTATNLTMPRVGDDVLIRQRTMEDEHLQHLDLIQRKPDFECEPPGRGASFADIESYNRSLPTRIDAIPHSLGVSGPGVPRPGLSPDLRRPGNKFPNQFDPRFDRSATGTLQPGIGELPPLNPNMPLIGGDARSRQSVMDGGPRDHPYPSNDLNGDYERRRISPSRCELEFKDREAGPFGAHRKRLNEIGQLEDHLPSSDWSTQDGAKFGNSFERSAPPKADELVQAPNGNFIFNEYRSRGDTRGDTQLRRVRQESDGQWEHRDSDIQPKYDYEGGFGLLERPSGVAEFDAGSSEEHMLGSRNVDYLSQKRTSGRPSEYDYLPRGGNRTQDEYLGCDLHNRKRTRDYPENIGRSWSVERKDTSRGRSRDAHQYGPRAQEDAQDLSIEYRDAKRGMATKFGRQDSRDPRDFHWEDQRASLVQDDRNHVFQRRDHDRMGAYDTPYTLEKFPSPRSDYRNAKMYRRDEFHGRVRTNDGRDPQRAPDRPLRGNRDSRHDDAQNWVGGRDHGRSSYSQRQSMREEWSDRRRRVAK